MVLNKTHRHFMQIGQVIELSHAEKIATVDAVEMITKESTAMLNERWKIVPIYDRGGREEAV